MSETGKAKCGAATKEESIVALELQAAFLRSAFQHTEFIGMVGTARDGEPPRARLARMCAHLLLGEAAAIGIGVDLLIADIECHIHDHHADGEVGE